MVIIGVFISQDRLCEENETNSCRILLGYIGPANIAVQESGGGAHLLFLFDKC